MAKTLIITLWALFITMLTFHFKTYGLWQSMYVIALIAVICFNYSTQWEKVKARKETHYALVESGMGMCFSEDSESALFTKKRK